MIPYEKPRILEPTSTKLEPCPFCGYPLPAVRQTCSCDYPIAYVYCFNCGARGPGKIDPIGGDIEKTAIDAWNRRSDDRPS